MFDKFKRYLQFEVSRMPLILIFHYTRRPSLFGPLTVKVFYICIAVKQKKKINL